MATLDDDLANAVTEGFRLAQSSIINQDLILSGTGDVTVTLANGSKKTGPSWSKLITAANAAGTSAAAAEASAKNAKTSETNANTSKNAAASSASAADTSKTNAKTSETNAKTSETNSKTSENNAAASASSAAASLAAALLLTSVPFEAAPFPDVWAPLNDDLRLLAGSAPYDRLTISGQALELATKSVGFTRAGSGTYINKSGVLQTADINEPRFEREGLLIEGQGTNSMLYSGDQNAAWWPKARCTTTSGFAAPDGSNSATKLMPTSELGSHYISKTLPVTTGGIYTLSYFVKAGEYNKCRLSFSGTLVPDGRSCDFDLVAGTMKPLGTTGTPTITPLSNGWYRCSITSDVISENGTVNFNIWVLDENGNTSGFAGDGVKGIYVWGAQLESNPVMTSYIPTTTAEVTRAQETLRLQPSGNIGYGVVGDLFNRTISFELSVNAFVPTTAGYFNLLAGVGVGNDIMLRIASATINSLRSSGSFSPNISVTYPFHRQIFTQTIDTDNTLTAYFNGQKGVRAGAPAIPNGVPTSINVSSQSQLVYHIRNFRIWHRLLTPNQINGLR
ncbi:phage head spike fiber domain-containing protein [Leclercia sp. TB492]|uniref:phage head spike fiber domain-containing protein n=1 Tax=Leclercia sp. TB492 TaxID=3412682 RepID=UPI003CE6D2EB